MEYRYSQSTVEADLYEFISNLEDDGWEVAFMGAYGVTVPHATGGFATETTYYVYMKKEA